MGPDKKPRTYRASSMNNLAQFNQRPEEFTKYLKDKKGIGIGSNVNAVYVAVIVVIALLQLQVHCVLKSWKTCTTKRKE